MHPKEPDLYRPPRVGPIYDVEEPGWKWILFDFEGRLSRAKYWLASLITLLPVLGFAFWFMASAITLGEGGMMTSFDFSLEGPWVWVLLLASPLLVWTHLAINVKRWHDRDKSGFWMLIQIIPYLGELWAFIELGCLRGTVGPNRYGPDPME